jgi:hypothetical protein
MQKIAFPKELFEPIPYCVDLEIRKEDLTCFYCRDCDTCPCAWDTYNTDGDCLMLK